MTECSVGDVCLNTIDCEGYGLYLQKEKQLTDTDVYTYIGGRYLTYDPHSRSLIETLRGTSKASLAVPFIVADSKEERNQVFGFQRFLVHQYAMPYSPGHQERNPLVNYTSGQRREICSLLYYGF